MHILLELSPEVNGLLADNEIDLVEEINQDLKREYRDSDYRVSISERPEGVPASREGAKGAELIILAIGATTLLVSQAISRILAAYGQRDVVLTNREQVVQVDSEGKAIVDSKGEPVKVWRETQMLASPSPKTVIQEDSISAFQVIEVKSRTETKPGA